MTVTLRAGDLAATFEPDAGLIGSSLTHRGAELLGQRGGLAAWVEQGKTFGIPFLHPWANRLAEWSYDGVALPRGSPLVKAEEHGIPIHGLLAGDVARWTVTAATDTRLAARLAFDRPDWLALFPYPHELAIEVELGPEGLTHATTLTATGDVPVPVAFGWHPYLQVPELPQPEWAVTTSVRRRLLLDGKAIPTGEVTDEPVAPGPLGDREFDHLYEDAAAATFSLTGGGRRIEVTFLEGYTHAQLFADQEQGVLAFEPMTAPTNALRSGDALRTVAPGESLRCAFRVTVAPH